MLFGKTIETRHVDKGGVMCIDKIPLFVMKVMAFEQEVEVQHFVMNDQEF